MNKKLFKFFGFVFLATAGIHGMTFAVQSPNPRSAAVIVSQRGDIKESNRSAAVRRVNTSRATIEQQSNGVVTNRSAAKQTVSVNSRPDSTNARSATITRSGQIPLAARSASVQPGSVSRAASSRATAVFDDVSKIGGGYATCREAYNTCMDQFCAKSNDTYRRCYCSGKITDFRDTEAALDQAKTLLMQFQDNNLNAIDKTASEVNAMYSATVGENAIKNDPSAAASVLSEIGDLLSGKKKVDSSATSLSSLSLDFTSDLGDIWGDNSSGSVFNFGTNEDLSKLEGTSLYNSANKQCLELIKNSCENSAVLTMAKSSYGILITQDCNVYEKKIDTQKEAVTKTVRDAEKILRESRLEEYRSHNSADVNACITNVKANITGEMACGENYKKCLDYTGSYIDVNTGNPIYSPQLFQLTEILNLNSKTGDVISSNPRFSKFLDDKKIFAEKALDSCRDKAATVWEEFKRSALIEIAQAQDAKIESIKNSCVSIMKECYDTQSGALASFDNTNAQATGALNAYAARAMCADKVAACAALYAGPNDVKCEFDNNGRLKNTQCGLTALLTFVQTVDNVKVAEGCEKSISNYAKDVCTPTAGDEEYPYACRSTSSADLKKMFYDRANIYCIDPSTNTLDESLVGGSINNIINDIEVNLSYVFTAACEEANGVWVDPEDAAGIKKEAIFYSNVFGKEAPSDSEANSSERGYCIQNTTRYQCLAQDDATGGNGYAKYDSATDACSFTEDWYKLQCEKIGGYWDNNMCYL
ncbi:MAG: hypothetical protein JW974_00605 [Alphaproteobacteria bacterium]|nr:hypothetical protein [Alphaproteobacteria bacterium]MBN2675249.1 hypothetical protein [Alphaproteobacteria bacterium]